MTGTVAVTAVVPAFEEPPDSLERTLAGLVQQRLRPNRIVVVDDASPTPAEIPRHLASDVDLVRLTENVGLSEARNRGALLSKSTYILFVNCDVVLEPHWLNRSVVFMEHNQRAGAVSGAIVPVNGPMLLRDWRLQFIETKAHRSVLGAPTPVAWLVGHVMLVRRSVFDEAGGFDARLRTAGEDVDFCERIRSRGHEVFQLPGLVASSHELASIDSLARKNIRNAGWDVRARPNRNSTCAAVQPVRLLPATASIIHVFIEQSGRNIFRRRFRFLRVDTAIALRSLVLVWRSWRH